ncbi:MAG: DUF481 domain-containing protein [Taibaiella sp.]|nr:DUF481 domain-containing protein [Taibaiella sp.]
MLLLGCRGAHAQFNDSTHYYVAVISTGTVNNTNTSSSYITYNTTKFSVKKKDISLNAVANWVYGIQQNNISNNDFNSSLDFNIYKTIPHLYYWGLGTYMASYSLKVNHQYQVGVGAAYNILDRATMHLNVSEGVLYERSDINLKDTVRNVYSTYRNSLRVQLRFKIIDLLSFSGAVYHQQSLRSGADYIVKSNMSLDFRVRKWLTLTTGFTYNRYNITNKENTLFTYGITMERYY